MNTTKGCAMGNDPNANPTDDSVDLLELVGNALEARGLTQERISKLDTLDTFPTSFQQMITESLKGSSEGGKFDEEGFLTKLETLLDGKLETMSRGNPPQKKK